MQEKDEKIGDSLTHGTLLAPTKLQLLHAYEMVAWPKGNIQKHQGPTTLFFEELN